MGDKVHFATREHPRYPKPPDWKVWDPHLDPPAERLGTNQEYYNQVTAFNISGYNGFPCGIPRYEEEKYAPGVIRKEITLAEAVEIFWRVKTLECVSASADSSVELHVSAVWGIPPVVHDTYDDYATGSIVGVANSEYKAKIVNDFVSRETELTKLNCSPKNMVGGTSLQLEGSGDAHTSNSDVIAIYIYYINEKLYCAIDEPLAYVLGASSSYAWATAEVRVRYEPVESVERDVYVINSSPGRDLGNGTSDEIYYSAEVLGITSLGVVGQGKINLGSVSFDIPLYGWVRASVIVTGNTVTVEPYPYYEMPENSWDIVTSAAIAYANTWYPFTYDGSLSCDFEFSTTEYWPYKNAGGAPVWDTDTGQFLGPLS